MTFGSCGFENNGISIYSSQDLANTGWRLETAAVLPEASRAVGTYWSASHICPSNCTLRGAPMLPLYFMNSRSDIADPRPLPMQRAPAGSPVCGTTRARGGG